MKNLMIPLVALFSANAFAASQLNCRVGESLTKAGSATVPEYSLTAPLGGASGAQARIEAVHGKLLNEQFGAETFISQDIAPGKQLILISATDANGTGTTAVGVDSAALFFDTTEGSLYVECHVQ